MGKLIEFSETIARAGAFLLAFLMLKELSLVLESFTKLNILTGIYIKFWKQCLPAESLSI